MHSLAKEVISSLEGTNLVLLKGELGAGKTTFAQGALKALGAEGPFTSPTFVIMKKYEIKNSKFDFIYHFDCYRVGAKDVLELGWEEIINNPKNLVLVEWPERIQKIIAGQHILVDIKITENSERQVDISSVK